MTPVNKAQQVIPAIFAHVRRGVVAAALLIETEVKLLAPVRTGNHRRGIHTDMADAGLQIAARITHYSDYGGYLERGTRNMRAQPHFTPAYERNRANVAALIAGGGN